MFWYVIMKERTNSYLKVIFLFSVYFLYLR